MTARARTLDMEALRRRFTSPSPGGGFGRGGGTADNHTEASKSVAMDPADYEDNAVIESSRWLDTEIAVSSIVAILVVGAAAAVWVSYRRRRLRHEAQAANSSAPSVIHSVQTVNEAKSLSRTKSLSVLPLTRKIGRTSPTASLGVANGNSLPVTTIVLTATPNLSENPNGNPEATGGVGPWEPYFLGVGLPGQVTQARRRSVSLRSADDEEGSISDPSRTPTPSRGPSPSPTLGPGEGPDGDATRKRSVTFNYLVEEVQFLRKT